MVSDLIALPVHKEITESSDPIRQETVQARGQDVTVWYDLPETNPPSPWLRPSKADCGPAA